MKISGVSSIAEPDNFAIGTDLTKAFKGITLSVDEHPEKSVVVADGFSTFLDQNFTSTGTRVFGTEPPHPDVPQGWDEEFGLLRIDFKRGTDFVQIDMGDEGGAVAKTLTAFDAAGNVVGQLTSAAPIYSSQSLSFDDARISHVIVGGDDSLSAWLDNFHFGVVGSAGSDRMVGTKGDDHYNGLDGNDRINGRDGNDILIGGPGSDTIRGGPGGNQIDGGTGDDTFFGAAGANTAQGGSSFIEGGAGNDVLSYDSSPLPVELFQEFVVDGDIAATAHVGGFSGLWKDRFIGIETVIGSKHDDHLWGLPELSGGKGDDLLHDGARLFGDKGNDTLAARADQGTDLTGGKGDDTFELFYFSAGGPGSVIHDFGKGNDLLVLNGSDDNASLTNEGDIWTVHFENPAVGSSEQSFQIVGVTSLDTSDFIFI